ncbi:anthranilate phosphoribosyltransferase [Candidatus Solincola tengchongensis]|uniref:anthranilate phosphoribosyltransferase n=1 Tax=Candidatus Solincola tengchongensis TaxID=2900693 RepID=UPI00257D4223|nr:anthranilate phosphoribosyltransferase [Candidatus Solincola tengchongensis]
MIGEILARVTEGKTLDRETAREVMSAIMRGEAGDAQVACLLTALKMRGETSEEIAGFAQAMREAAVNIRPSVSPLVDTCGTGGDGSGTFNISTAAAFIAAGAGVYVAKHGNRGVSSSCGSADVLEALGVDIEMEPERVRACIEEVGIGFLFAPRFHPAMRHVMRARREMGIPTAFNLLGPLTNPAGAQFQLLGVGRRDKAPLIAHALADMRVRRALVVHGEDGLDEVSTVSPTLVWVVEDGGVRETRIKPDELGLAPADPMTLRGGSAEDNACIIRDEVLSGKPGPRRDISVLNAAAALYAAGMAADLQEGISLAQESVDSGRALRKLEEMVDFSREASRVS